MATVLNKSDRSRIALAALLAVFAISTNCEVAGAQQVTISGRIHVAWGDPPGGPPVVRYAVSDDQGRTLDVAIPEDVMRSCGGPRNLNGR